MSNLVLVQPRADGEGRLALDILRKELQARTGLCPSVAPEAPDGAFVAVGVEPQTKLVENQLSLDAGGYILAGEDTATAIPGVFAAGDVRTKAVRQVVTAAADGAVAAHFAEEYLLALREGAEPL